jgi:hypothetical protein
MKTLRWAAIILAVHNSWSFLALVALIGGEWLITSHRRKGRGKTG